MSFSVCLSFRSRPLPRAATLGLFAAGLACGIAVAIGAGSAAVADSYRWDWSCSGAPRQPCVNGPIGTYWESFGSSTAVNQSNPYAKCAAIYQGLNIGDIARVCALGYTVRAQSNDAGWCPYPNYGPSGCNSLSIRVGNDTDYNHGLRGVGYS